MRRTRHPSRKAPGHAAKLARDKHAEGRRLIDLLGRNLADTGWRHGEREEAQRMISTHARTLTLPLPIGTPALRFAHTFQQHAQRCTSSWPFDPQKGLQQAASPAKRRSNTPACHATPHHLYRPVGSVGIARLTMHSCASPSVLSAYIRTRPRTFRTYA